MCHSLVHVLLLLCRQSYKSKRRLRNVTQVVFFTGAGISVDSGIPTFQEQEGIRDKLTRNFTWTITKNT